MLITCGWPNLWQSLCHRRSAARPQTMATPALTAPDLASALVVAPATLTQWLVILPLVVGLASGAVLMMLRDKPRLQTVLAILSLGSIVVLHGLLLAVVMDTGIVTMTMGRWLPPFGISFTADLTGALLSLAGAIIGLASGIYAISDIDTQRQRYGFYPLLLLLMAGSSGAFLTGDIFNLYVWFEVLLISAFGLMVAWLGKDRTGWNTEICGPKPDRNEGALVKKPGWSMPVSARSTWQILHARRHCSARPRRWSHWQHSIFWRSASNRQPSRSMRWLPASLYHTPRITVAAWFAGLLDQDRDLRLAAHPCDDLCRRRGELLGFVFAVIAIATMLDRCAGRARPKRYPQAVGLSGHFRHWHHAGRHCSGYRDRQWPGRSSMLSIRSSQ